MRWLSLVLAAGLVACETTVIPSPSPSPSPSPTVSPPPPIVAREETPRALLSLAYTPPSVESVGATASRIGGISPLGPASLAVDENDRIYIWDQARLRVVVYESGRYVRSISLPFVERHATALLVDGDRLYLRASVYLLATTMEYEIDATTGALLRATTSGSIYPRSRRAVRGPPPQSFGADAAGLEYIFTFIDADHQRYERHGASGALLAYASEPVPLKGLDAYVRADGALYELAADIGGVGSVYVYALLSPIGRPGSVISPVASTPTAFGRTVPDRVTVMVEGGGSADLDQRMRRALWWLASFARERLGVDDSLRALFVARWDDGSVLEIRASQAGIGANGKTYIGPAMAYEQLASYVLASPSRLAGLTEGGVIVRITDLPRIARALTPAEIAAFRDSLSKGFSVSEGELPFILEDPFPLYEIVLGDVVIRLRGDDYGSVGEPRTGAFAHDGTLDDLARRWLPVPTLSIDDVRSLFLADKVTFEQRGYSDLQDITRWKASIVRALSRGPGDPQSEPVGEPPAILIFRLPSGRTETVVVSRGSFTFRGRVIALPGVMTFVYLRGVP